MAYWLAKSEPDTWSWADQEKAGTTYWDGVRNAQASNNLKAMRTGDSVLFYHSGDEKRIVGIVKVVREYYPDPSDPAGRFGMVDLAFDRPFVRPVTLAEIKADPEFADFILVRHSRLSVMPVTEGQWRRLCALGGTRPD